MSTKSGGMRKVVLFLGMCIMLGSPTSRGQQSAATVTAENKKLLPYRWSFIFGYECNPEDVVKIKSLIDVSAEHGLNGIVLSSFGLDGITRWDEKQVALLKEVADYCAEKHLELIPTGFSVGYGGGVLGHDRSFAAALPATVMLKAKDGKIVPENTENLLVNGDLEAHKGDTFPGYGFHDKPGEVSFADQTASSGKSSIRFEGFGSGEHGHGRIMQKVAVKPGRTYRFTFKLKTQDLQPVSSFQVAVNTKAGSLASLQPDVKSTQDWTEGTLDFINKDETEVLVYAGVWEGKSGKFWLDDLKFAEYGDLSDIVRRDGTPLTLRSRDRDVVFEEGRDFRAIRCLKNSEAVPIPPRSSIREGERLELTCYKIPSISHSWGKQISLCMSNPDLYPYWEAQAKRLHEILGFKKILLSMDEIRNGGGCLSCQKRGISMAEILGDCITRQHAIFKAIDPEMEVMIWSDMLDPAHNAHGNYYGVIGDFTGSWKYVPKDLTMMCWYHKIRDTSLAFFSSQGFRTFGAAYYDADDLVGCAEWLKSLGNTPNAQGILYTTWEKKYRLLSDFGDLVSGKVLAE